MCGMWHNMRALRLPALPPPGLGDPTAPARRLRGITANSTEMACIGRPSSRECNVAHFYP